METIRKQLEKFGIVAIMLLAGFLNMYKLWDLGYGNSYYAAAIKSMLTSFSNFFFVSFDATGFISVDKAPLSLWVDTIFAKIFGFSGFTILLPHALEGMLVTLLVYLIVKKVCGTIPALVASLVITLSPVNVAVYRNNTPDALLLVFILVTLWFFIKYFESSKLKYLLVSALMLGLGFNTKMLQAYLILPALLLAILIFSPGKFHQRLKPTMVFMFVLAIVSFSWITIVDLTPANLRPYVGSSGNNSAWSLALGYNGVQRLAGETGIGGNPGFNVGDKGIFRLFQGEMGTQSAWFLVSALLFSLYFLIVNAKNMYNQFIEKEKINSSYQMLMLTSIFFLDTQYLFFSSASFFHSYYLNILALPIALIIGGLLYETTRTKNKVLWLILGLSSFIQAYLMYQANYAVTLAPIILVLAGSTVITLLLVKNKFIATVASVFLLSSLLMAPTVWSAYTTLATRTDSAIFIGGPNVQDFNFRDGHGGLPKGGMPGGAPPDGNLPPDMRFWYGEGFIPTNNQHTVLSVFNNNQTFDQFIGNQTGPGYLDGVAFGKESVNQELLAYLKKNYSHEKYFVVVSSSQEAAGFILDENIGNIMNLGGFSGRDQPITLEELKTKIKQGEVRFFYLRNNRDNFGRNETNSIFYFRELLRQDQNFNRNTTNHGQGGGMFNANEEINSWVISTCTSIENISGLYDCQGIK